MCIARIYYCFNPGFRFNLFHVWARTNTADVTGKFCHQYWRSCRSANARKISIFSGNLSEDGQVEVIAYGSPLAALDRAQDIVRGGKAFVVTDENIVRVV